MDFTQKTTDKVPAVHRSDGADTCARVNALIGHSFVRVYMPVGSRWYDVRQLMPLGDGWVRVYVRDEGYDEDFYFTEFWNRPFLLHLAGNREEYLSGTRNTDALPITKLS